MKTIAFYFEGDHLLLNVRVTTRASKNEIQRIDDFVRIRINTPPVDGKANQHLIKFLGKVFGVPPSTIILERGETHREKRFRLPNPTKFPKKYAEIFQAQKSPST